MIYVGPTDIVYNVEVCNDVMDVYGEARDTTVITDGLMRVESGGLVSNTFVNAYASGVHIYSGGRAFYGNIRGNFEIYHGGEAHYLNIDVPAAQVKVNSGGTINYSWLRDGRMYVYIGGSMTKLDMSGGNLYLEGHASSATISGGVAYVSGGKMSGAIIRNNANMQVYRYGSACDTVMSGGVMVVSSGGVARNTAIGSGSVAKYPLLATDEN